MTSHIHDLPLDVCRRIATLADPTQDAVRDLLPSGLDDQAKDALASDVRGLFEGRTPDPAPERAPEPAPVPAPEPTPEPEPATSPAPSSKNQKKEPKAPMSLADQMKLLLDGDAATNTVDESDFERDPIFTQIFQRSDEAFAYSAPEGYTSPGPIKVNYSVEDPAPQDPQASQDPDVTGKESVLITWPKLPNRPKETTLYRVIAADHEAECAPGAGTELVITHGTAFRDERPNSTGLRHYMVWAYTWDGGPAGLLNAPALFIGEDVAIYPPRDVKLVESNGTVNGSWDAMPGHDEVRVYHARQGYAGRLTDPGNMLVSGVEQSGFSYRVSTRGLNYDFTLAPVVSFRGRTHTGPAIPEQKILVSAEIQKVSLITAGYQPDHNNEDQIILEWEAPPTGQVRVFLTDTAPDPELPLGQVDRGYLDDDDALGSTKWTTDDNSVPGEHVTRTLVWPADWHQVYITPVNIVEQRAWVGDSRVLQRVENITDPQLVERVSGQLITFDWPAGATHINVRTTQDRMRLDEDAYRRQGGVRLNLLNTGDKVTLTPAAIWAGKDKYADSPTEITYPGLRAYSYDLTDSPDGFPQLQIWSVGNPDANAPHFRLVHNPSRLPLHIGDGSAVTCAKDGASAGPAGQPQPTTDLYQSALPSGSLSGPEQGSQSTPGWGVTSASSQDATWWIDHTTIDGGYLRLFVDEPETPTTPASSATPAPAASPTPRAGFSAGAFGGSLGNPDAAGTGASTGTTPTSWNAATIPAIVVESVVTTKLAYPSRRKVHP
ncbi:MAG: cell surface glycoprotein [Corynebacterium sp.]|uniref:cell surface glycoprotein n=1 Tax=Corynebacterium sp. TaxID=1720 RepID=UPI003F9292B5